MSEKSAVWDIDAEARVTFVGVAFKEEVSKEEAIQLFLEGDFDFYEDLETDRHRVIKITGAEV